MSKISNSFPFLSTVKVNTKGPQQFTRQNINLKRNEIIVFNARFIYY